MPLFEEKEQKKIDKKDSTNFNKSKLIEYIANVTFNDKNEINYYFDVIFFGISKALENEKGKDIPINDFGKFFVKKIKINNPELNYVGEVNKICFKPSKKLKDIVNDRVKE